MIIIDENVFTWPDYLVFFLTLIVALVIGVYHAVFGKNKKSTSEYLLGSRQMSAYPLGISLLISNVSAITLIGNGAELYFYGIHFWFYIFAIALASILGSFLFVPLLHPLKITSVQQYLVMRFESKLIAYIAAILQLIVIIIMNSIYLFGPCIMMETVTGFPLWLSMLITGLLATAYTTIGGFKAVIWADVFQASIIIIGYAIILTKGILEVGGITEVWSYYKDGGRLAIDFDLSPFKRLTLPVVVFLTTVTWLNYYSVLQPSAQRYLAARSLPSGRRIMLASIPGAAIFATLGCSIGILAYAYYAKMGCDPYSAGKIQNRNQAGRN